MQKLSTETNTETKREPAGDSTRKQTRSSNLALCRTLLQHIFKDYRGSTAIRLWTGEQVIGSAEAPFTLTFRKAYPLRELLLNRSLGVLADAHLNGDVDGQGDPEVFFELVDYLQERKWTLRERLTLLRLAVGIAKRHRDASNVFQSWAARTHNGRESISHHYDVSNAFYRLFLDPEMVYSCAYFSDPGQTLEAAQKDKLDYLCRKLRLRPGQSLLDIGCGWGGLAFWAARHYGARVHGITLSQQQFDYATARAIELGLEDKVRFELRDYRELSDAQLYDRIVSVGMFEHIGIRNFPDYFSTGVRLLKEGGLFLNHGITNDTGWRRTPATRFINEYIFPDGELARISDVTSAMEDQGLEILDIEQLRPHYAMTLRHWVARLDAKRESAVNIAGDATYRLWRLYMAGSAHYFTKGSTGLYQILACRSHQPWPLPLRRDSLYSLDWEMSGGSDRGSDR